MEQALNFQKKNKTVSCNNIYLFIQSMCFTKDNFYILTRIVLRDFCFKTRFKENKIFDKNIKYVSSILDGWF